MKPNSEVKLKWEAPPPSGKRGGESVSVLVAVLRERPGVWALVYRKAETSMANNAASYLRKRYKLEVVSRGVCVYARWPKGVPRREGGEVNGRD